jgi:hypothetical protein
MGGLANLYGSMLTAGTQPQPDVQYLPEDDPYAFDVTEVLNFLMKKNHFYSFLKYF